MAKHWGISLLLMVWGWPAAAYAAALASAPAPEPAVVLPPWVIEEAALCASPAAREDSFAATLGPAAVVTAAEWSGRPIATLAEALRGVPGLALQESFGGFEPPRLSLRGSGLDSAPTARGVALLADGLPLARADGSFHSGLFDPLLFARVEVYRGTMNMALTPAVLGGVLHAVSSPAGAATGVTLRGEGGDFGQARGQLSVVGPQGGLAASLARSRGWREHSRQDRQALLASGRQPLGAVAQLEGSAYLAAADYEVPGPLTLAETWAHPRGVSSAVRRDRPRREAEIARLAGQVKSTAPQGAFAAGVAWLRLRDDFVQLQANGETVSVSDDFAAHATASHRLAAVGGEHHLLARATLAAGTNNVDRHLNDQSVRGARFGAFAGRARTAACTFEDLVWLRADLAAGLGVTALHARREIADRFAPAGAGGTVARRLTTTDLSPRAGLTWQARRGPAWRLAVSRGGEPPSFDDLVSVQGSYPALSLRSRELRAQRATTLEIGAHGHWRRLTADLVAYRGWWRGEILRLADASGLPRGAVNAGATLHEGIEAGLRWRVLDGPHRVALAASSTLGRCVFDDDPVYGRNRLAGAPPHVGRAELAYEGPRGGFGAIEATWLAGRTAVDHAGRLTYGGHALFHARAGWRLRDRWTLFLAVRNLLERSHLASTAGLLDIARTPAATAIFLPGVGRAVTVGCEWRR